MPTWTACWTSRAASAGRSQSPTAAATVTAHSLAVEGQTFAPFTISARYADGVLTKTGGPWAFTAARLPVRTRLSISWMPCASRCPRPRTRRRRPHGDAGGAHSRNRRRKTWDTSPTRSATSRYSRSGAGQRLLAALNSLPATPEGTVWVPSVVVSGPFAAPAVQATLRRGAI